MTLMNVDPLNEAGGNPTAQQLLAAQVHGVRFVSRPGVEQYAHKLQDAGLLVLAVVTEESGGFLCPADIYQIGNEPDIGTPGVSGPNSMTPQAYAEYWRLYRDTYPDPPMITAGLASGQSLWWANANANGRLKGAIGFAVHPYGKDADHARSLIQQYRSITPHLGAWITEWNRPSAEIPEYTAMLRQTAGIHGSAWFCWSDLMVPPFGASASTLRLLGAS